MTDNLKLYVVDTQYINYLKQFQEHIWDNDDKGKIRPYIGILIPLNNFNYYAPLSSPKQKHDSMKDRLDFIRIDHKNELKCVINLNNIIPVNDFSISLLDIENEEELYRNLLNTELIEIRKKQHTIINNSGILYNKITRHIKDNPKLANICYDFKLLEEKCNEYRLIYDKFIKQVAATEDDFKTS
ncbi:type III toxin-antitoxin system ToxN/AbiQ family toxin [Dehalobacter restrictus]|uniref:Type III toxin-antitoxin system ToxN/AbiQ family toxin n=1 Tax=Dehalobacter restrictus TaxID=55583 RepID=A0A857DFE4_9FIRM|nr:type III toxin-antitoxin system ToxN/AbiQ family toxin [Dehalobacter restrictus]QGZ99420.1 type III toxin-antitoxin system ToxN/AbiQ family toxin [Dehalobacter restrictus]